MSTVPSITAYAIIPGGSGYRMPAEWEYQAATWIVWPHNRETWPGCFERIEPIFAQFVSQISRDQRVEVIVPHADVAKHAWRLIDAALGEAHRIFFHTIESDDSWVRDTGPTFVVKPNSRMPGGLEIACVTWEFNAWGGKYPPWSNDGKVGRRIAELTRLPSFAPGIYLEGGSIEVNGAGTLITTEQCLLNPNRNPGKTRDEIENILREYLGVHQILWLGDGIVGDDTDGHVDDITRFVAADTVITAMEPDTSDANHEPLLENKKRLESFRLPNGQPLRIVDLPMPEPVHWDGVRLPASYANFLITNGSVIVPTFRCPRDEQALAILRGLFPNRQVVGIDATELVLGLGSFHCLSQQQPGIFTPTEAPEEPPAVPEFAEDLEGEEPQNPGPSFDLPRNY